MMCAQASFAASPRIPKDVLPFYEGEEGKLFWSESWKIGSNKRKIPDVLENAFKHGLNPDRYEAKEIQKSLSSRDLSDEDVVKLDYAMTYALWRYVSDLAGRDIQQDEFLNIATASNIKKYVEIFAPHSNLYVALKARLKHLDKKISKNAKTPPQLDLKFSGRLLKVGDAHSEVPLLRARLMRYDVEGSFGDDPYNYDSVLAMGVKEFQLEHALKADGVLGPTTLKYLNRTLESERKQIVINMERLRQKSWRNRPDLRIDVDIARYWLKAFENNEIAFEMPVVVGSTSRKTISFSTIMTGVRLNPGWTLPPTIKTEDYIPKLRSDPEWVTKRGVKIYMDWEPDSEPIDPMTVDWSLLSDGEIKAMRMFKSAGVGNPLGQYRFLMNNHHDIYLHDTNKKYLFDKVMRAKSSGCVRLSDPHKVAEFLLLDDKGWTSERLDKVLEAGETFDLGAKRSIPVYFDYKTVWLNDNGGLILGYDVYDFDNDSYYDILKDEKRTKGILSALLKPISLKNASSQNSNNPQKKTSVSLF